MSASFPKEDLRSLRGSQQAGPTLDGRRASVILPATCGELVQGTLDGVPCLVSCPIDLYGTVEVTLLSQPDWTVPADAPKAAAALHAGLEHLNHEDGERLGGRLQLTNDLPRSRGYASSTVDVAGALYALGHAVDRPLSAREVAHLAVAVEPSDSTMFPGLALLDHRGGTFHRDLGPAPALSVIVLDPGGAVDTLGFNRRDHYVETLQRLAPEHREAFDLLAQALQRRDWHALGEAATLSARVHQVILENPWLDQALKLARTIGALGICRAHSGTLLGLLLDPASADVEAATRFVRRQFDVGLNPRAVAAHRMVDGGPANLL